MTKPETSLMPMSGPTLSQRIAAYVHDTRFEAFEGQVIQRAKEVLLYDIAQALLCRRDNHPLGAVAADAVRRWSPHGGPATLIGYRGRAMPLDAAFLNASQMRAYQLDDVIFPGGIHSGLMTIPVALALAEDRAGSGRDVLSALILAYEVMGKFAAQDFTWDADTPRRPTIVFGPFGAAIAAGRMLQLDREQLTYAIGYAVHCAQGVAEQGVWRENGHAGLPDHYYSLVARAGMTGAMLAQVGGGSSLTALEGRFGFFETFLGRREFDADAYMASLGKNYQIINWIEKRYKGTGLNILGVELTREIVMTNDLRPEDVREVRILLPEERRNFAEGHTIGPFDNGNKARGALVYHMAMAIVDRGRIDFRRYEQFASPEMRAALAKIRPPVLVPGKSNIRWTRVEMDLADGRTVGREGESYTFPAMSGYERLSQAADGLLTRAQIERCHDLIMSLEKQSSIAPLMACLVPESADAPR